MNAADPDLLALKKAYLDGWQDALRHCPHVIVDRSKG